MNRSLRPYGRLVLVCTFAFCTLFAGFVVGQPITAVEYYLDQHPSFGNGIPIPITPGNSVSASVVLQTPLTDGFHFLYIHARDSAGVWGIPTQRMLWHQRIATNGVSNIVAAEYYFDNDHLRFGSGASIPIQVLDSQQVSTTITIPPNLTRGFHYLTIRLRDELGQVGLPTKRPFWVDGTPRPNAANINAAECYFDVDPGRGNGVSIPVNSPGEMTSVSHVVDLSTLTPGFHFLYTRVRDADMNWSAPYSHSFWAGSFSPTTPNIVAAEYFLDSDPGFGQGREISVNAPDSVNVTFIANLDSISGGYHNFYLRTRDSNGSWSSPYGYRIYVNTPPGIPGFLLIQYLQGTGAALSWSTSTSPTIAGYRIYRSTNPYFHPAPSALLATVDAQTVTFTDTSSSDEYYYLVTAFDDVSGSSPDGDTRNHSGRVMLRNDKPKQ